MVAKAREKKRNEKTVIPVTGMTCTNCAATIEKGLAQTPGVESARVNFTSEKASVEYDPSRVDLGKIKDTVAGLGYGVSTKKSIFPVSGKGWKNKAGFLFIINCAAQGNKDKECI